MSRIGKKIINIPEDVQVSINQQHISCKGPKGELNLNINPKINIKKDNNQISFSISDNNIDKNTKALHGLSRSLTANMIHGVKEGYTKTLEVIGVGYRMNLKGRNLELSLGFSHLINFTTPDNIEIKIQKNQIIISGVDKQLVGQVAAQIRDYKKPEPYKGKGIKYIDEIIKRKAGKTAKTAGEKGAK